jgi:hypothetical protein
MELEAESVALVMRHPSGVRTNQFSKHRRLQLVHPLLAQDACPACLDFGKRLPRDVSAALRPRGVSFTVLPLPFEQFVLTTAHDPPL